MSSRSKDKVAAAIRKFFKSPDKKDRGQKDKDHQQQQQQQQPQLHGASGGGAEQQVGPGPDGHSLLHPATLAVAGAIVPSGSGSSSHNSVNKASTGSPMRRLRCAVAPSNNSVVNVPVPKPLDTTIRSRRLMKELKEIERLQHSRSEPYFTVELVNDNLYEWHARLYRVDPDSPLAEDLAELNIPFILLHLVFPDNFPFAPPFMRVVEPRIEKGFVMEGGAICMELLTPRGWASAYTVEAVLMQFAASLTKGQGRVSRKPKSNKEFTRRTAEEAFRSLVKTHEKYGWVTPALNDG
ncbi:ubiquitin-conjugating enzyme E2Q-like protein 1 [Wyeomyia smithii]|uniref:ubiquitin-conjugating enzyme E2Q-like protein 1 n=1 Tax=Wyeomyia smithii TaxID=174621 RepID=UPI00246812D5|nr:ubiquitin-conjugating enzyme E2Q-like protein 1 [Wyeomyia smithii]XP_055544868.1 ubiquitin-conjugating enzyme E2Q-like protein 1 [Wyeomyia smithii]XP_055544869.1 ubiquitin-conjugating enzyme E2Q-like protein 1 [Wyeomyia smithii]